MREIYDVVIACESMAAELLAALPESERRIKADALDALNATMGLALQENDLVAWAKADDEFHRLLVVSCGNGRIARIAEAIMDQSHPARMLSLKWRPIPTKSVEEHQQIVESIRKGLKIQAHNKARSSGTFSGSALTSAGALRCKTTLAPLAGKKVYKTVKFTRRPIAPA